MKGQFSRLTARRARRYSSVRLQQGRVHLDADFNEQVDIGLRRDRTTTGDVVGPSGVPLESGGFALSAVVRLDALDVAGSVLRAVGARGTVLASADGGATWTAQALPNAVATADLTAVDIIDATHAAAVTASGQVLLQADGATWTVVTPPDAAGRALRGIQFVSATTGWIVGDGGLILGSSNGGAAWTKRTVPGGVVEHLRAVHFPSATRGWAVGDGGRILATDDGGATWVAQAPPAGFGATLRSVRFAGDALHGWAVGDGGAILTTADGGATWVERPAPAGVDAALYGVDVASTDTAWAVGGRGAVLRTTNGGAAWTVIAPNPFAGTDLRAVRVPSAATALVAGDFSALAKVGLSGGNPTWLVGSAPVTGRDLAISAGRVYLDGLLVENDRPVRYLDQPNLPDTAVPAAGTYVAYLDAWTRHVTAVERPELREVALGGPDTATRTETVWQVRIDPTALAGTETCADLREDWAPPGAPTGRLRARGAPMPITTDDCLVPAGGGYRRLENLLYRVEVQTPGPAGTATFTWSRENGSAVSRLEATDPAATARTVTVADPGRDPGGDFAGAAFVELTDDRRVLTGQPGVLLAVAGVTGRVITLEAAPPPMSQFGPGAIVRRWDGTGTVVADGWRPLATTDAAAPEDGIEVQFAPGTYATGDHWTIPARTLTGDVDWPRREGSAEYQPREGDDHRYTPLGIVAVDAAGSMGVLSDCRVVFPPLAGLESLVYVAGDGQEVAAGGSLQLPDPAVVGVARGPIPVADARVRFTVEDGGTVAGASPDTEVRTDAEGLAAVAWELAAGPAVQHLTAELLDAGGQRVGLPVRLGARLRTAASVSFEPTCPDLQGAATVQEALDRLCQRPTGTGGGCCHAVGEGGEYPDVLTAVKDLLERRHGDVCLCLQPGRHEVDADALAELLARDEPLQSLEIGGQGAVIGLDAPLRLFNVARLVLRDIAFVARQGGVLEVSACERVDIVDVHARSEDAPPDAALVTIATCRTVRVSGSELAIRARKGGGPPLRELIPVQVAEFFEAARELPAEELHPRLAELLSFGDADRIAIAKRLRVAAQEHLEVLGPERVEALRLFSQLMIKGESALPSVPQLAKILPRWRHVAEETGPARGFPAAILFLDGSADAWVEANRLEGGVSLGSADRDPDAERAAEEPFRVHDVQEVPAGGGRLRLDRNVLDWVSLGPEPIRRLAETNGDVEQAGLTPILFDELLASGNTFRDGPHVFLATSATLGGNVFERAALDPQGRLRLGFVAAATAAASGNLGPGRGSELVLHGTERAEAANAGLRVT